MATATRTVLFTDLADYTTKVSDTDRMGLHRILEEHEQAVRPLVEQYGGHIVKNIGDSFLCLFRAATDALRAGIRIQEMSAAADKPGIRIAVTTGDVEEIKGDAFGSAVNLAARVLGVTPVGETWFSQSTKLCINETEVPWEAVGRFRLKGIPGEQACFRAVPRHQTWLPMAVASAAKAGQLVRITPGAERPALPPNPVVLFSGFKPGSVELGQAIGALPVLKPDAFYLAAYTISAVERLNWTDAGRGLVIGVAAAIDATIRELARPTARPRRGDDTLEDSTTMLLDIRSQVDLQLVLCGLALPAVPLSEVVAGYSYDLTTDGQWVTYADRPVLRIEVKTGEVLLHALEQGVSVDGALVPSGQRVTLSDGAVVQAPAGGLRFRQLSGPYQGVLLADTKMWLGVMHGDTAELGRKPNPPGLAYPNREGHENIQWCSGPRAARAREGQFSLDRVLTGRRQAAISLLDNSIRLAPLHQGCPTYVLRQDHLQLVDKPVQVQFGDMVVAGTTIVDLRAPE